jgi:hypothetical protein
MIFMVFLHLSSGESGAGPHTEDPAPIHLLAFVSLFGQSGFEVGLYLVGEFLGIGPLVEWLEP